MVCACKVRVRSRYSKIALNMQHCEVMESSDDDCARNMISRRSFLGGTALVVLPVLCGGCNHDDSTIIDLPAVANNAIVIHSETTP